MPGSFSAFSLAEVFWTASMGVEGTNVFAHKVKGSVRDNIHVL